MRRLEGFRGARAAFPATLIVGVLMLATALVAQAAVGDTMLVSRGGGPDGAPANGLSGEELAISSSGRYVAFVSEASNLSPDAPAGVKSVYLRDMGRKELTLVSRASGAAGAPAGADSVSPAVSPGGRYVAFESVADNLSDEDNDAVTNVYLRDTLTGTTKLMSRASGATGAPAAGGGSFNPSVSYGADAVAFESDADNLTIDANPAVTNVFVREKKSQATKLVSRGNPAVGVPDGIPADDDSTNATISFDGQRIAFQSAAANLSAKDNDAVIDVFVRDLKTRSLFDVSCRSRVGLDRCPTPSGEAPVDGDSTEPAISRDGGYVAFSSDATNLVLDNDHPGTDVFIRGLSENTTKLVSRAYGADGAPADGAAVSPTVSGEVSGEGRGQFVAFLSVATNLGEDQTQDKLKVFVRDTLNNTTALVSRASGASGEPATDYSAPAAISADGNFLAFTSEADNLSSVDDDGFSNVFLRALDKTPPPPPVPVPEPTCHHPPCSGGEAAHTGTDHGGAGHAGTGGHGHDAQSPGQTLFAPRRQGLNSLYVIVQVHEESTLRITARVNVPGGAARVYRFKSFKRKLPIHATRRVRLRLTPRATRAVKRALRRGMQLRVRVTATALDAAGNRGVARRSIRLLP